MSSIAPEPLAYRMHLEPIPRTGLSPDVLQSLPLEAREVVGTFLQLYDSAFVSPWIGYIGVDENGIVGTCAFKTPPRDGAVEIAYFTFPGHEGRGVATRMARALIAIAQACDATVRMRAQTLPHENASTRVLRKLGFTHMRDVEHPEDGLVWEWEQNV